MTRPQPESGPRADRATPQTGARILRFLDSERALHWALAVPFLLLYFSAAMMLVFWGEPQPRTMRAAFATFHKLAGIGLLVLPPLALLRGRREWRVHLANVREAWSWDRSDIHWLMLMPIAAVNHRVTLPDQGKFNAAEKLNFMMLSATYPAYLITGILIWAPGIAFVPWIVHVAIAVLGLVLVVGHVYMATVNPDTRVGLQGMVTGWVDREWARHHYRRWYRGHFEVGSATEGVSHPARLEDPASLRCSHCGKVLSFETWTRLLQRTFQVAPLFCGGCGNEMLPAAVDPGSVLAGSIARHAATTEHGEPFQYSAPPKPVPAPEPPKPA